ncbi:hypothetical protein F4779DRAFT_633444 [Xylariaceae sp. FL0662B]|nr:hypothetical protein F4779DRAFT_633444 [Xylariaceae sp. FL0662B]
MKPNFDELEFAACDVVQIVKQVPELRHCRLAVIGGLALQHYLPDYRPTDNVNFITNISTSPSSIKRRLLERPSSPFFQRAQVLFYQGTEGKEIQVDISPEWLSPYLPAAAVNVRDIPYGEVPYISLTDLIVFKLDSAGLRSSPAKKDRDARDAAALVEHYRGALALSRRQKRVAEEALCDVARCGTREKRWWDRNLGLDSGEEEGEGEEDARRRGALSRPHANSDSAYDGLYRESGVAAADPNAAWYYERLDRAHMRRFGPHHHSSSRGVSHTMTQPKTTHVNYFRHHSGGGGCNGSTGSSPGYGPYGPDCDGSFYYLEPRGGSSTPSDGGYFDIASGGAEHVNNAAAAAPRRRRHVRFLGEEEADSRPPPDPPRRRLAHLFSF